MNKRDHKKLTKAQKQMVNEYEGPIEASPDRGRPPKPKRSPPPPPIPFDFDADIFQTENQSLKKFKIISVQSRQNKKFKSFMNESKVKILKKLDNVKEIYHIFQE